MIMEDRLVSYELAKLAKENGFNIIDVYAYYQINIGYTLGYALCYSEVNEQEYNVLLAPTQSLLQKWLRDKHEIHVFIIPCIPYSFSKYKDLGVIWIYTIHKPLLVEYGCGDKKEFTSYEDALDACLFECLGLINKN